MPAITAAEASDLFRRAPDRFLDVGAGEAAYWKVGEGPDVLFVHGWPVTSATFRLLLPHLVEHVTCHLIDLPSSGSSRFDDSTPISIAQHITSVRRVIDLLGLESVAVVGHDSGGMIARHAVAGDPRLRAMGLIDTEHSEGLSWRFKGFIANRHAPGIGAVLGWAAGNRTVRRNRLVFGGAFHDRSLLDGEFDEFFLQPLHTNREMRGALVKALKSFDMQHVRDLTDLHRRITVPVQLVWGEHDIFFPVAMARKMVATFPDAQLAVIPGAGLFSHEERPAAVAEALLPVLTGTR